MAFAWRSLKPFTVECLFLYTGGMILKTKLFVVAVEAEEQECVVVVVEVGAAMEMGIGQVVTVFSFNINDIKT